MCLGLFFFSCLENLPDYLTFPVHLAQKPGWAWDSDFSFSPVFIVRAPRPHKLFLCLVFHEWEVPVAPGRAGRRSR